MNYCGDSIICILSWLSLTVGILSLAIALGIFNRVKKEKKVLSKIAYFKILKNPIIDEDELNKCMNAIMPSYIRDYSLKKNIVVFEIEYLNSNFNQLNDFLNALRNYNFEVLEFKKLDK